MLDFTPVRDGRMALYELTQELGLTVNDLRRLTNEMLDRQWELIAGCEDADVTFVPHDPDAADDAAADPADFDLAWTLGHVIVHVTASAEEAASIASELARGVQWHGRSRAETPWQTVTTLEQCRARLEESRRMRLALLDVFPDAPALDNLFEARPGVWHNCISRFVGGLSHDDSHLEQIVKIVAEARVARVPA